MAHSSSINVVINGCGGTSGSVNRRTSFNNERTPLLNNNQSHEVSLAMSKSNADMATGVSWGVAAFLLVNSALGAGMLNYPFAYNQIGGVLAAALIQIVSINSSQESPYSRWFPIVDN